MAKKGMAKKQRLNTCDDMTAVRRERAGSRPPCIRLQGGEVAIGEPASAIATESD